MAFNSATGVLTIGTGSVGTTYQVTGLSFQPKVLLVSWIGRTETGDAVGRASVGRGFGFATGPSARRCGATRDKDAVLPTVCKSRLASNAMIATLTDSGVDGLADVSSFDANGFTLIVDDQFSVAVRVSWLALGGADLTNTFIGGGSHPAGGGTRDITTVGFQPDAVIFLAISENTHDAHEGDGALVVGAACGATPSNALLGVMCDDNALTISATYGYCRAAECFAEMGQTNTKRTTDRMNVSAWLANGFRENWVEIDNLITTVYDYLCIKGGSWFLDSFTTRTDGQDIPRTGYGFRPGAALVVSGCRAESTIDTPTADDAVSLGFFTAPNARSAQASRSQDAQATAVVATAIEHDAVYANVKADGTLDGLMDVQSCDADGATFVMDDPDPSANFVWVLAANAVPDILPIEGGGAPTVAEMMPAINAHRGHGMVGRVYV